MKKIKHFGLPVKDLLMQTPRGGKMPENKIGKTGGNRKKPKPVVFIKRLRDARDRAGLSNRRLAHMVQTSEGSVSRWIKGTREPSMASLVQLSGVLSVSLDWLLGVKAADKPTPQRPSIELVKAVTKLVRTLDAAGDACAAVAALMPDEEER